MEITLKHYGNSRTRPSIAIQITVTTNGSSITEDVTDLKGNVSVEFIHSLRQIADELEEQNNEVKNKNNDSN